MKINVKEAKVTSNVPQENVTAMSISIDGMEHIMDLLTNLYKDPQLAVIREYYTNALDAHVEAGVTSPVKITLPTWDDPSYRVQDFGVGMSKDDITNIYAQYGASTKRNTNDQVGAFGLGCKSALTITQQFTVVSVKDGFKTTVLIAKSESGINTVNVISSIPTTEGNGTLVQIPVSSRLYDFISKANKFFAFSRPGTVLVDGVEPVYALSTAQKVEDPSNPDLSLYLKPKSDGESYVLMGPVPYALSQTEIQHSLDRLKVQTTRGFVRMPKYMDVPIGSVDLTPSREGLRFTDKTNEIIDAHMSFLVNDLKKIAQEEINAETTLPDILATYKRWNDIISIPCEWNGEKITNVLKLDGDIRYIERSSWGSSSHTVSQTLDLNPVNKVYLVTGYSADLYKKVNGYITPFLNSKGEDEGNFIITDVKDVFDNKWVKSSSKFEIIAGDDIIELGREERKAQRLLAAKSNGSDKKTKITYPVLFVDEGEIRWVEHPEIDETTPYLHAADVYGNVLDLISHTYRSIGWKKNVGESITSYFEAVTDSKEIILLNKNRTVKALQQRVKKAYSLVPEINASVEKVKELMTDDLSKHYAVSDSSWKRFLVNSGISNLIHKIKDPDIRKILAPQQSTLDQFEKYNEHRSALSYFSNYNMPVIPSLDMSGATDHVEELNNRYPLVETVNIWQLNGTKAEHMVKYFNAVHEELNA